MRRVKRFIWSPIKQTKKYSNLIENPAVSLLIDTREKEKGGRRIYIKALTVSGEFQIINDAGKKDLIRAKFLKRHSAFSRFPK